MTDPEKKKKKKFKHHAGETQSGDSFSLDSAEIHYEQRVSNSDQNGDMSGEWSRGRVGPFAVRRNETNEARKRKPRMKNEVERECEEKE